MYKVFFNDYRLIFTPEYNNSLYNSNSQVVDIVDVDSFFLFLSSLEEDKYFDISTITRHDDPHQANKLLNTPTIICHVGPDILTLIFDRVTRITAAGGLVRNRQGLLLFIKRFGRWDLPKGKVEENESAQEAAIREVGEECGLDKLKIISELRSTLHFYRSSYIESENNWVLKETIWFEMLYEGEGSISPQTEENIEAVAWHGQDRLNEIYASIYPGLRELLDESIRR